MTKPRLIKISYFVWIIVPLALWVAYESFGLPHVIWSRSWIDQGQGMNPFAQRHYTRCLFIGPYGQFDQNAINGRCGLVRFFVEESSQ